MLVEFRVTNFRSLRTEQSLSFVAGKSKEHGETHCIATQRSAVPHLLRSAVIYGANASGKSNLVAALATMQTLVLRSTQLLVPQFSELYTPFQLDSNCAKKPTEFEITLLLDGIRYQYGFAYNAERICGEWLLVYQKNKPQRWFEYHFNPDTQQNDWEPFSTHFKGHKEIWKANTTSTALFLTQATQSNSEQLQPVFNWFMAHFVAIESKQDLEGALNWKKIAESLLNNAAYKAYILGLIHAADKHIIDIKVEQSLENSNPAYTIYFCHKMDDGNNTWFELNNESLGTRRLLAYAALLKEAFFNNKLLVIDEFDTSLHPLLSRYVISLFHRHNAGNAQLCVTTHDTSLLDNQLLRTDQIWLLEKQDQQNSHVYSLAEYSPRKHEALERGYLMGRYGGIPFLQDTLFWEDPIDGCDK